MAALPHSCRVIRLRALPGCDLEPGWASKCSEAGKCGACAAEWGAPHLPGPEDLWGTGGQTPFLPMDPEGGGAICPHRDPEPPPGEIVRTQARARCGLPQQLARELKQILKFYVFIL